MTATATATRKRSRITQADVARFERDGFLVLRGFYDLERDIEPIQRAIHRLIGLMIEKHRVALDQLPFEPATFDAAFLDLVAADRAIGSEIYDAVKQIPAFARLVADRRNETLFGRLRGTDLAGLAAGSSGIRIDIPGESKFSSGWHQEYPSHLRSMDGLVLWSPLVEIDEAIGPVRLCAGSHADGLVPVHRGHPDRERTGAYALVLENEAERVARYTQVAPLASPGDLVVIDYLTLHASSPNTARRARWSMQARYFNFLDPTGLAHGWPGSFAAGRDFATIHPELVADGAAVPAP